MFVPCSVQINRLPRFFRSFSNWKKFDRSRNVIFPVCRVNEYTGGYAREGEDRSVEQTVRHVGRNGVKFIRPMIFHRFGVLTIKYALKRERGLVSIVGKKKRKINVRVVGHWSKTR